MPLPTLMLKGNLKSPTGDPELKRRLDDWVPLDYVIDWLRTRAGKVGVENRVLILKSETASGKSTAFPPELYKKLVRNKNIPGIICTQPRVATAIENVIEMLKHNSSVMRLGETIGWSTKYNKFRPKLVGLLSATIGTLNMLLRSSTDEEVMRKYKYILIDETHERDLQTDMTIYMLKNLINRNKNNPDCPFVVLMSATFDPMPFLKYFGVSIESNFIWVGGQTAQITEMWDWNGDNTVSDYTKAAASVVERIVTGDGVNDDPLLADILIFMPGKFEFSLVVEHLTALNKKLALENKKVFNILQIDGPAFQTQNMDFMLTVRVPTREHEVIINKEKYKPSRRVIISTNVAETGLTLDNLKYVIDAGYNREIEFNPIYGIRALITKPAPHSRIRQRRGRAGRKFDGVFYPLYPKHVYDSLPVQQFPQILIEDISPIILDIITEQLKVKKLSGNHNPEFVLQDIDMIDVPTSDSLAICFEKLYTIGFLSPISPKWTGDMRESIKNDDENKYGITKLGLLANGFSMIPPECVRLILSAYFWGCSILDAITIATWLMLDAKNFIGTVVVEDKPPPRVNINWVAVYKMGLPNFIAANNILYKMRLLIADEFIHGLILFNAIKRIVSQDNPKGSIVNLRNWCQQNHISYRACLDFIRARDDVIEQMLIAGLEIFNQEDDALIRSTEDNFMDIITRIKYCIYDGFRNNLLVKYGDVYKTLNGLTVNMPKLFREDEAQLAEKSSYGFVIKTIPHVIIYRELSLKFNKKTQIYEVNADRISVCDGFISYDPDFAL